MRDMKKKRNPPSIGERRNVCGRNEIQLNFGSEGGGGGKYIM